MTLIIAADTQDHLILAGDHCAVLSGVSNAAPCTIVLDHYRKVYPWKYGAIAASGDVFLMVNFLPAFLLHERRDHPIDLLHVAREAKAVRTRSGVRPADSVGNIFLTLPGDDGFRLHGVSVREKTILLDTIEPISTRFSMRKARAPDEGACNAFNGKLRPSFFFGEVDAFHSYQFELLNDFFARQSMADALVTPSFDVFMLDKRTGEGRWWRAPNTERSYAALAGVSCQTLPAG